MNRTLALGLEAFSNTLYYVLVGVLVLAVLFGIYLMSKVEKAKTGNRISAVAMALAIILTLVKNAILPVWILYVCLAVGLIIGLILAFRVKMIEMPQMIALFNGFGGLASAIVGGYALFGIGSGADSFSRIVATIAFEIGIITFFGSLVAAGKLHRVLPQKQITLPMHKIWLIALFAGCVFGIMLSFFSSVDPIIVAIISFAVSTGFGLIFALGVGGADMPITISLLNSLSGVAASISGLAIGDALLVAVGGIVGASGLLLTQIMCKAMNRKLFDILFGGAKHTPQVKQNVEKTPEPDKEKVEEKETLDPVSLAKTAKDVIIVPGYGMAIAQAQHLVKQLADYFRDNNARVRYAIHPVAGRMPGHMNVLLAEADVDYDDLYEMDSLNDDFKTADLAVVIGANDVMNPAAREAEGTPIYGMPILNVDQCPNVFVFNYDLKPGYSGVDNPLYSRKDGLYLFLGNASETLKDFLNKL